MLEKPKIKKVDKQEKQIPNNIEQLIEYYGLENVWTYMEGIIDYINKLKNDSQEANDIINQLNAKVGTLEKTTCKQIIKNLSTAGWYRVAFLGASKGAYGLATVINISRKYDNNNNEAMVLAISLAHNKAKIKNLNTVKNSNLITKARIVYDTDQKVYFEIYYEGSNNNYIYIDTTEKENLKLLDFKETNSGVTVLKEETFFEYGQELELEQMGCGGNWNNKLIQRYNSICTISANGQELGIGAPTGAPKYGTLITLNPRHLTAENYSITQIYIPSNPEIYGFYIRKNNRDWSHFTGAKVTAIS